MQDILTYAATAIEFTAIAFVAINFPIYAWKRAGEKPSIPAVEPAPEPESIPATTHELEDALSAPTPTLETRPLKPEKIAPVMQAETPIKRKRGRPPKIAA